ncbi:hypothetical protein AB0I89_24140 [Micromonospora sp. NPDC049801]|uniref:hypothetical protein n=1 Tax=unclassified Micromonospora TaxID=2617518 RepID=UPI0033C42F67
MPRGKYSPPTSDVADRIDEVVNLYNQLQEIDAKYREKLGHLADKEGDAVPIAHLAARLGVERKTVYRHLGRSMT